MEIYKQAKALLNGEVVELKKSYRVQITDMHAEIDTNNIQYSMISNKIPNRAIYKFTGETFDPMSMDYNKKYYLVEVDE